MQFSSPRQFDFFLLKLMQINELKTMMRLEFVVRTYFWSYIFTKFVILRLYECTKHCLIMLHGGFRVWYFNLHMLLYHTAVNWTSFYHEIVFSLIILQYEKTPEAYPRQFYTNRGIFLIFLSKRSASSSVSTLGSTIQIFTQKITK